MKEKKSYVFFSINSSKQFMYKYALDRYIVYLKCLWFKVTWFVFSKYNHEHVILVIRKFSEQVIHILWKIILFQKVFFAKFQIHSECLSRNSLGI